jgi:hypothetical protein
MAASVSRIVSLAALALGLAACTAARKPGPTPVSTSGLGVCGEPGEAGVLSKKPRLRRADRDLNGDGQAEVVVADETLCNGSNCYWNLFSGSQVGGCRRYLGTVAAEAIDRLGQRSADGYHDLRGWWRFASGDRHLVLEYRYRLGGYRVTEAMVCGKEGDDRLVCAPEEPPR